MTDHLAKAKAREYSQRWRERHPEAKKRYYAENRDRLLAQNKEWRQQNAERYREQARRNYVKREYGLSLEEYEEIRARGCAICGDHATYMHLDHDHKSGQMRDALCHSCNVGLGSFREDPARLEAAIEYVRTHANGLTERVAA